MDGWRISVTILFTCVNVFSNGVYTHCVPSKTIKETKSPLDF